MIMLSDDELVALWHQKDRPAKEIAERLDMTVGQLVGQWRRLKTAGKLPTVARTPEGERPVDQTGDGRPSVGYDPLLDKLNEAHELHSDGKVTERTVPDDNSESIPSGTDKS